MGGRPGGRETGRRSEQATGHAVEEDDGVAVVRGGKQQEVEARAMID